MVCVEGDLGRIRTPLDLSWFRGPVGLGVGFGVEGRLDLGFWVKGCSADTAYLSKSYKGHRRK